MRKLALISVLCLITAACGEAEDTRPGQPVKTRQQAFKDIIKAFEPMGTMLRDNRYDAERFEKLAEQLVARRDAPWTHFGPDTNYPPSKSTDDIWQQPERFAKDRDAFVAATDRLLAAAKTRDKAAVEPAYKAVYETCQDCHKAFRKR